MKNQLNNCQAHLTANNIKRLSTISAALMREKDEGRLLNLIAQAAIDITGAKYAAFTLRPTNEQGEFLVSSKGSLFYLAAVMGVTPEQEELLRRTPLGGDGVLKPIFHSGEPVRIADISLLTRETAQTQPDNKRQPICVTVQNDKSENKLFRAGMPLGHPIIRSFLGVPLLDCNQIVRGGLLLGHPKPDQFHEYEEHILLGLAAQAAIAIENVRLYRKTQRKTQELDSIFEHIADGLTIIDQHGKILRANSSAQKLQQYLKQTHHGRQALESLLYAPSRAAFQGRIETNAVISILNEDNEEHDYVISVSPLHEPNTATNNKTGSVLHDTKEAIKGVVIVWHDVTEVRRLQLEQHMHAETEARRLLLQSILDELPESIYLVHGSDARLVLSNAVAKKVWRATWQPEQSMAEFLQQNHISLWTNNGRRLSLEQLITIRAVRFHETIYQQQEIIRYADGTALPVLVNGVALDARQLPISLLSPYSEHISETEPFALVIHLDVSLIKEAERVKDDFISIAAHELRNPLAVLHGFVNLLLKHSSNSAESLELPWQQEALENIDQATKRLMALTDDLLDVTRLQTGRLELHKESVEFVSLLKRVVQRFQITHPDRLIQLHTQLDFLGLHIDIQRIEQVILNLLDNATKYSSVEKPVEIVFCKDEYTIIVAITDYGIGIPQQEHASIFGRFMRAENAREQCIEGTGLGLYLCRELIEIHGGHIWFHSIEGQGSTFYFSLPYPSRHDHVTEDYL